MTAEPTQEAVERFVLGPVSECDDLSEDGGELWQAEIQLLGGYAVAATIYAGSAAGARRMAEEALAAWNARASSQAASDDVVERITQSVLQTAWGYPGPSVPVVKSVREGVRAAIAAGRVEPSIFDLLEPLADALRKSGGPEIGSYFARATGGVDIEPLVAKLAIPPAGGVEEIALAGRLEALIEADFCKPKMPKGSVHLLAAATELRARATLNTSASPRGGGR